MAKTFSTVRSACKETLPGVAGKGEITKAYVVFSSTGPLLVLTRGTIRNQPNLQRLREIGCTKFIAREIPVERVRSVYGVPFGIVEAGLGNGGPLRVLDHDGESVFGAFSFAELGRPVKFENRAAEAQS